jgi:Rad3-related DNA helicase
MDLILAKNKFSKYSNSGFRPFQKEAIEFALKSEKKIVILEAATGSGKSLCGMTAGSSMGGVTYLVHSKILQNQITDDFPEAKSLFGRSNYTCLINPAITCDECHSTKSSPCDKKYSCLYEVKKREVLAAKYKILNYDYFLSEANYVGRFSGAPFVVIDEADNLENTLINFTTLTFTPYALRRMDMLDLSATLKMTSKFKDQLLESWKDFGRQASYRVKAIIKKMSEDIEGWGQNLNDSQTKVIKERVRVVRLLEKIDLFLRNVDQDWILDIQEGKLIFRPLWMTPELANEYLWDHGNKFVLMSASFYPRNILAKCLGLDIDDMDYHMVPSQFPIENRPIYIYPVANMTAKTVDVELPKLVPVIKQIADARPDVKGIVHAVSYKLAHQIVDLIKDPRFVTHNSDDRQDVLTNFVNSIGNQILVSPSLERGVSLEEDKCRLIIIAKAPYLSLGDRIISTRLYSTKYIGNEWYKATMMLTLLQMAGRGVRSKEDFCECFILDAQAKKAITERPGFLPEWWLQAINFELPEDIVIN